MNWQWRTCSICGKGFSSTGSDVCSDTNAHFNIQQRKGHSTHAANPVGKREQQGRGGSSAAAGSSKKGCSANVILILAGLGAAAYGAVEAAKAIL